LGQLETIGFSISEWYIGTSIIFMFTEVGKVTKHFIDCGGTVAREGGVNFSVVECQIDYEPPTPSREIGPHYMNFGKDIGNWGFGN